MACLEAPSPRPPPERTMDAAMAARICCVASARESETGRARVSQCSFGCQDGCQVQGQVQVGCQDGSQLGTRRRRLGVAGPDGMLGGSVDEGCFSLGFVPTVAV